jgi:predicted porin
MMIRGFRTISSRAALAATAGILMGGVYASAPAYAADLGGGCCADLEERVAELEATTARKGNRVVSLQVYGQVNKALLFWDDGVDSDVYVTDNDYSGSRVGFTGKAAMKPGWTAGFLVELDIQDSASDKVFGQGYSQPGSPDEGTISAATGISGENEIVIRYSNVYIESEPLGRITLGQGSTAADGAAEVVLGNSLRNSDLHHGNDFQIRLSSGGATGIRLDQWASNLDPSRDDMVRYDSPSIYGFIVSASWGDNDYADVALRFKKEWNSVRVAAAIAYQWDGSNDGTTFVDDIDRTVGGVTVNSDAEVLLGSISVMHIPTGFYTAFAAGEVEVEGQGAGATDEANFWYVQLGLEKKFLPYGSTTFYAEYGLYQDMAAIFDGNLSTDIEDSEAERWGFGIVQKFDSAAIELYAQATFWSFEAVQYDGVSLGLEDLSTIMVGSRIKF